MEFVNFEGDQNRAPLGEAIYVDGWDIPWDTMEPEYEDLYEFVTESYEGSGKYITGDYLVRYPKEYDKEERRRLAYYKNYIKGIVDSLLVPVFSQEAIRSTDNEMFTKFLNDVNLKGTNIQDFTANVVKYARLHGVCYVVMDNISPEYMPETLTQAIDARAYPYMYYRTADEVESFSLDSYDRIQTISFDDGECMWDGEEVDCYRLWTPEYSVRYIELDDEDEKIKEIEERVYHNLGFLPVIPVYIEADPTECMPMPPVYDLCRMNFTIYNMDSEQRNLERMCAFPMLTIQTRDMQPNLNVGTNSVITYGGDFENGCSAPSWISPNQDILTVMSNLSQTVLTNLIEAANVLGATAINTGNSGQSGVALAYEFQGQQFSLMQTARVAERFEIAVAEMFGKYTNQTIDYAVVYKDNFAPAQDEIDKKVAMYEKLLEMNMSPMVNAEIMKNLIGEIATNYKWDVDIDMLKQSISTYNPDQLI